MQTVLRQFLVLQLLMFSLFTYGQDGLEIANLEIEKLAAKDNYLPSDILEPIITDDYISNGIRHIYYQQTLNEIGIYGTSGAVHIKDGQIIASNLNFLQQVDKRNNGVQGVGLNVLLRPSQALARLSQQRNYPLSQSELLVIEEVSSTENASQNTLLSEAGISNRPIPFKLVYYLDPQQELKLAWSVFIDEVVGAEYKNYLIDAEKGEILFEQNLTITCTFEHHHEHGATCSEHTASNIGFEQPSISEEKLNKATTITTDSTYVVLPYYIESPNFGERDTLINPTINITASPYGWHHVLGIDYEYTYGNNVDAYADRDNTNDPTGQNAARAFGGPSLIFDYPWDASGTQTNYTKAAVTNLFYMNNVAHDIFYNYGFDEASGNFQEENYDNGGNGSDLVFAEAQDAGGTCNANMTTPGDGANPRMQMFLCSNRDGDFDNAVILHEYGHGISNRLTGGPQAVACLGNVEQMGEGWSDFFGLVVTMKAGEVATTNRTIGTWLFNQGPTGAGLRPYPYTTDMAVNPMTYNTIGDANISRPHGVGAVWCTMLWDMTWTLIDQYGWDPDIYNGTGGNNIALKLVMEGLKLQPCSPGFVDARDAILAADLALYDGANRCIIWEAFARRGLGYSADQGSSGSREDGTEGYDMPPECTIELIHTVDKENAFLGERLTYHLEVVNHLDGIASNIIITDTLPPNTQFYSASDGGTLNGNIIEWPAFNLGKGATKKLELKVTINDAIVFEPNFIDDLESGRGNWEQVTVSGANSWDLQSQYYYSPDNAFFIANANYITETHLVLKEPLAITDSSVLSFNHYFDLEDRYDFGLVEISVDGGTTWIDLEDDFTQNGYNNYTQFGHYAFSRYSTEIQPNVAGYITTLADLSEYAGEVAIIRFRLLTDINTNRFGWIVDDIGISNTNYALPNFSNIRNTEHDFDTKVVTPTIVSRAFINHTVETATDSLFIEENSGFVTIDVQANDIDPDAPEDTLTTTILRTATNGTITVMNNDSLGYTPNVDFIGQDTVVYQVCDELNACESDTLFIFVEQPVAPPITSPDFVIVLENSTNNNIDVQANDSDPNGLMLTTALLDNPNHGVADVVSGNTINYSPFANYFGLDTLVYQVCNTNDLCTADTVFITIQEINKAPVTVPDILVVDKNTTDNFINVQANDTDPNGIGDSLITSILNAPNNGIAIVENADSIAYTPNENFIGFDTIIYQVCDTASACDSDTIFITVNDVNEGPVANPDNLVILEGSSNHFIDVQGNDFDPNGTGDSMITNILITSSFGIATVINDDSINYMPTIGYFGLDTIVYQVCDTANVCDSDTVFITITEINKAPIANTDNSSVAENSNDNMIDVQANDTDPNGVGDSLTTSILETPLHGNAAVLEDNEIIYTPMMGYIGLDTVVYQVCDTAFLCDADTLFINVFHINLPPTANPDFLVVDKNTSNHIIDVQANDTDPEGSGDTLITTIVKSASNGTTIIVDEDSISYTPNFAFVGLDTVVYQVCDTTNACDTDTLFITVNDYNEPPVTAPDFVEVDENSVDNMIDVQANDSDPNEPGDSLITFLVKPATNGTTQVLDGDSILFTPTSLLIGLDTIVYQVCDTANLCAIDTVFINIVDDNKAPIANADFIFINENSRNNFIDVQANDVDPNLPGDTLTTVIISGPSYGVVGVANADSIIYTPTSEYFGLDTIVYEICDTASLCAIDTVFITIEEQFYCEFFNLEKSENEIEDGSYVAANEITSAGVISEEGKVRYVAGTSITLMPGFHAVAGADFTAMIENCESISLTEPETEVATRQENTLPELEKDVISLSKNSLSVRPNPFSNEAIIDYAVGEAGSVWIGLYDLTGRLIKVLVDEAQPKGIYQQNISSIGLSGGAYLMAMRTQKAVITKKIIVLNN